MLKQLTGVVCVYVLLAACTPGNKSEPKQDEKSENDMKIIDPHSFAKTNDAVVKHLSLKANVDFETKQLPVKLNGPSKIKTIPTLLFSIHVTSPFRKWF